jgi:16S rRNA (guanine966-N2)-methyltransferase
VRISGGEARGTKLRVPKGARPASERVRQAVFSSIGDSVRDARVLDLYCGSGAYGLEALSRGATRATFVDSDARAMEACGANAEASGLGPVTRLRRSPVEAYLRRQASRDAPFDLVFVDPPYASDAVSSLLGPLEAQVVPGGLIVVESRRSDETPPGSPGLELQDDRRYGDTRILVFRRLGDP